VPRNCLSFTSIRPEIWKQFAFQGIEQLYAWFDPATVPSTKVKDEMRSQLTELAFCLLGWDFP